MLRLTRLFLMLQLIGLLAVGTGCTKQARRNRHLARADRYYQAEQYDKAEIEYLKVTRIPPLAPSAVSRLGLIYYTEGKLPQAAAYLKKAIELQPNDMEARLKLGFVQLSARKFKEARQEATWILEKDPTNTDALTMLVCSPTTTNELQEIWQRLDALPPAAKPSAGYNYARANLHLS